MSRFPPIPRANQTPEQQECHDFIDESTKLYGDTFTQKNSDGAFLGPFTPVLYTPSLVKNWIDLNLNISKLLSPRERELAILAVMSYAPAAYGLYAHVRLSRKLGLTESQIQDAKEGRTPKGLSEKDEMTYELARELARLRAPLSNESFAKAEKVLGKEGVAAVIHTAGIFLYSTIIFNGADVPLPEGESI
ncbi:hypothetical protein G7Y89_g545 [Cudoniella acicularis]|uniref:Carboxymuconolactone decarboxylase-like domain-containing protein n=1 Tax=Cudoniella acicularis TaxID=354080 RepID=A0A8H4RY06_9HELO|nr:hypothetical protein G7Y89_g545 [Cudoniella acicularis]